MSVSLVFDFDAQGTTPLASLRRKLTNLGELHKDVGNYLVQSTQDRFEAGQAPNGSYWLPSARSARDGGQPLTDRGHLSDSITYKAGADGVEWGSNLVYAAVHQFGALIMPKDPGGYLVFRAGDGFVSVKSVTIEPRPYLGINADDEKAILDITEEYITEALGGEA